MDKSIELVEKFSNRSAVIGVVGAGYVGLPLAIAFCEKGFSVVALDVNEEKIKQLRSGNSYIEDVPSATVRAFVASGALRPTTDYEVLASADAIAVCVPTPITETFDPDVRYVDAVGAALSNLDLTGKLIALESTIYPGGTRDVLLPHLVKNGLEIGTDVFLAFSPERIDPGRLDYTIRTTPKLVSGLTDACLAAACAFYKCVVDNPVATSSMEAAETAKLLENTFRAVNIGFVNELAMMCDKMELDVWEIINAAGTKPYGFMSFYPGPGIGGHCIPVDPHYLNWKLRTLGFTSRFVALAGEINEAMPEYVVNRVADALNDQSKPLRGSKVLVLGVAYKPNVGDVRESPALPVMRLLEQKGVELAYSDPYVETLHHEGFDLDSVDLDDKRLNSADCVLILTDHRAFDWSLVETSSNLIVDTRHAIKKKLPHLIGLSA